MSKEHLPPKNIEKRFRKRLLESLGLTVTVHNLTKIYSVSLKLSYWKHIWTAFSPTFGLQYFRRLFLLTETVVKRCSVKKVLLEISQNLQENTCARISFFDKVAGLRPKNFAKFLRTPFPTEQFRWLLLYWQRKFFSQIDYHLIR